MVTLTSWLTVTACFLHDHFILAHVSEKHPARWNSAYSVLRLSTDAVSFNGCSNQEKGDFGPTNQVAWCAGPRDALAEIWEAPTQPTFTHKAVLCTGSQRRLCASSEEMTQYDNNYKHLSRRMTWMKWNKHHVGLKSTWQQVLVQVQVWAPTWTLHVNVAQDLVSSSHRLGLGPASLLSLHVGL